MGEVITGYGEEAGLCGHDGSVWIKVKVDADGHLQVDGVSVALPADAATATNQITMITALQLIDDLRSALGSVNTDDLQVDVKTSGLPTGAATQTTLALLLTELQAKIETADLNLDASKDLQVDVKTMPTTTVQAGGGDKIFSFESVVSETLFNENLAAGENVLDGTTVPSGKIWRISSAAVMYSGTAPTSLQIYAQGLAGALPLLYETTITSGRFYIWAGEVYAPAGVYLRGVVTGATAGNDFYFRYAGLQMDAP